jgi:hypothetical protein
MSVNILIYQTADKKNACILRTIAKMETRSISLFFMVCPSCFSGLQKAVCISVQSLKALDKLSFLACFSV